MITLNKIEIDYWENRHFPGGEPEKRSQQFREIAKRVNDNADAITELQKMLEILIK
jgi:hypothetical protein